MEIINIGYHSIGLQLQTLHERKVQKGNKMDKWDKRFMDLAEEIAHWTSCYKTDRSIGAIIVKNKRIVTTGYNVLYTPAVFDLR